MAIIKLKRSDTPGNTPASLEHGEVAINIPDKKIYIGSGDTNDTAVLIVDGNAVGGGGYTAPTLGSTVLTSGATITSISGLSSVSSTSFVGALTGNASTVTNGVYTTDTGTVTNTMLAGSIANNKLTNSSITVNGSSISLGGSATVTANTTNALTIGTGLSGTSFNGSGAVTIAIDSTVATLTGSQVLTNKTISGSDNTLSNIANASLTNSSITVNGSSISLGGSATVTATATNALTLGTGLTGTSYNGSTAVTAAVDTSTIATRAYVDTVAQGLHTHATAKTATTATLATLTGATVSYAGGAITWTGGNAANGASFNDGTTLTANTTESLADRILVKNEGGVGGLGASKNGTYYVYGARELRRTSDGDAASDWLGGDFCFITSGTLYADTGWVQTEVITTLDTDSILWQQFSGAGAFTADETTLTLNGTQFSIKNTYVGQTSITTLGTIATGTWNATAIGATRGGTGQTTYATGDLLYASSSSALSKLTIGANNYVLTSDGTNPVWTANTGTGNVVRASSPTITSPSITTSITTGSTSFDAFNTTATTLNIGGACSTALNLAVAATGNRTVNIATGAAGNRTINIANDAAAIRTVSILANNSFGQDYSVVGGAITAYIGDSVNTITHYAEIYIGANATGNGDAGNVDIYMGTNGLGGTYVYNTLYTFGGVNVYDITDSTRDGIALIPRAGGTSNYTVNIQPTTLSGVRTLTLPDTTGTVITSGDTGTVTNTMLAGSIANNKLTNSAITINSSSTSLGGSVTLYLGTTTLQTSSANQAITGISSIAFSDGTTQTTGASSGADYLLFAMGIV